MFKRIHTLLLSALLLGAPAAFAELDDPMRPPGEVRLSPSSGVGGGSGGYAGLAGYQLSSTLVDGGRRLAVINGRRYAEGDRVGSARVEQIMLTKVVLRFPRGARTVHLLPNRTPPIKRPSEQ